MTDEVESKRHEAGVNWDASFYLMVLFTSAPSLLSSCRRYGLGTWGQGKRNRARRHDEGREVKDVEGPESSEMDRKERPQI